MKLPQHAVIAGSTKCGTTSLFQYLSQHPQICTSVIKETRFYWEGNYELPKPLLKGKEAESYNDFFPDCVPGKIKLEATPDYMYSADTAKKIKQEVPECKIIFILRNPQERIISWFKYAKQREILPQECSMDDFMKLLKEAAPENRLQYLMAMEQGKYGNYLQIYFDLFGKENIHVAFYEVLQNSPGKLMKDICDFLKIDGSYYTKFDFRIYNPSLNVKSTSGLKKYVILKKRIRSYNNRLPDGMRKFFKNVLKPIDVFYLKSKSEKWDEINLSSHDKTFLTDYYSDDNSLLEKILDKKITW